MFQVQPLSQQDPRWKNILLGNDKTSTIGTFGCLVTCLTMVGNAYGANETPASLNDKMKSAGGFQGGLVIPAVLPAVVSQVHFNRFQLCENPPAPLSDIEATLASGGQVIVEVDYSPAAGLQSHWVILLGKSGNDYVIQDPWPFPVDANQVLLTQRFGFAGPPQNIIKGVIWIDAAQPQPQPQPIPKTIPTSGFAVYPTVDGLALRQQPFIAENNLIIRLPLQEKLYVAEDTNAAQAKIGVQGKWIQVIETQKGYQGYVAGWYVAANPQPTPAPTPPPAPTPAPAPSPAPTPSPQPLPAPGQPGALIVYALSDGLALRSQPVIGDTTLIRREPLNAQLLILEPAVQAQSKLGVVNQWLQVQDILGVQGYVAAWYVSTNPQLPLGVAPVPSPALDPSPDKLVVRSNIDNLALRTQPVIADSTLIKRYPLPSDFLSLEPVSPGLAKIGQTGQWLNVQTIDGQQGYVAAWYVGQCPLAGQP